ncbi:flagellar biosynthetic protein FliO [Clostridium sp. Cult1]|uniref:flagellar biosynthetic protein FliO n=1 Tax=Clostridium sp. Cult1 TaxID=2079002 RepID=UPI001F2225BC|nr:flagellar biosynthetic protein FliO [Clostridium sp. Cult1]MCF6463326.1 hypothetical protein [Clostridium sp. Cult1]
MKTRRKIIFYTLILILLICSPSFAAGADDYSLGKTLFKLVFYIFITILVLIITIYGTRFIAKNSKRFVSSKYIQILDILNLGTNFKIVIVDINKIIYILAITNNNVEVLNKVSREEFNKGLDFEDQLHKYRSSYFKNFDYFNIINSNIKKMFEKPIKDIDKEDGDNEKNN